MIPDIEREPRVRMVGRELGTNRNLQSFIDVPLMYEGHVVGTMEAACYKSGALGVRSAVALQHTAEVASLALRRAQALSGTNFAGTSDTRNQSLALGYAQSLGPTLIAEARFGAYRYRVRVEPGGANTMPAAQAGIPGLNLGTADTSGMPAFYVNGNGGFNFGYSLPINQCNCPLAETENHFQWVTNWTKIAGNHTIGWGADLRRAQQQRIPSDSHRSGEITFDPSTTGSAVTQETESSTPLSGVSQK